MQRSHADAQWDIAGIIVLCCDVMWYGTPQCVAVTCCGGSICVVLVLTYCQQWCTWLVFCKVAERSEAQCNSHIFQTSCWYGRGQGQEFLANLLEGARADDWRVCEGGQQRVYCAGIWDLVGKRRCRFASNWIAGTHGLQDMFTFAWYCGWWQLCCIYFILCKNNARRQFIQFAHRDDVTVIFVWSCGYTSHRSFRWTGVRSKWFYWVEWLLAGCISWDAAGQSQQSETLLCFWFLTEAGGNH